MGCRLSSRYVRDQEDLATAISYAGRFDWENGVKDCGAALEHLRALPEVAGEAGVLGFCFGGTLAYLVAAAYEPDFLLTRIPATLKG